MPIPLLGRGMTTSTASDLGEPLAVRVRVTEDELQVHLADGRFLCVPLSWFPRLLEGTAEQRNEWRLIGAGQGIHWESLDEDLSVKGLLRGTRPHKR